MHHILKQLAKISGINPLQRFCFFNHSKQIPVLLDIWEFYSTGARISSNRFPFRIFTFRAERHAPCVISRIII